MHNFLDFVKILEMSQTNLFGDVAVFINVVKVEGPVELLGD